jgi:hypothetical protein
MQPRRILRPSVLALAGLAGCADLDPKVGPSQESCAVAVDEPGATPGKAGYGSTTSNMSGAPTGTAEQCAGDAGSPCDLCESTYCCQTRLACYRDPVCLCADQALDLCLDGLGSDKNAPSPAEIATCRDAFSAHGSVEQARMACEQSWCGSECAPP